MDETACLCAKPTIFTLSVQNKYRMAIDLQDRTSSSAQPRARGDLTLAFLGESCETDPLKNRATIQFVSGSKPESPGCQLLSESLSPERVTAHAKPTLDGAGARQEGEAGLPTCQKMFCLAQNRCRGSFPRRGNLIEVRRSASYR